VSQLVTVVFELREEADGPALVKACGAIPVASVWATAWCNAIDDLNKLEAKEATFEDASKSYIATITRLEHLNNTLQDSLSNVTQKLTATENTMKEVTKDSASDIIANSKLKTDNQLLMDQVELLTRELEAQTHRAGMAHSTEHLKQLRDEATRTGEVTAIARLAPWTQHRRDMGCLYGMGIPGTPCSCGLLTALGKHENN